MSYQRYKKLALNNKAINSWFTYYAKKGFAEFYHKRINELEKIQKELLRRWHIETNQEYEKQDTKYIILLASQIRENNKQLCALGMSIPYISRIKETIDDYENKIIEIKKKNYAKLSSKEEFQNVISEMSEDELQRIISDKQATEIYKRQKYNLVL